MQVTMTFKFPEDKEELHHAQRGRDYYLALIEVLQECFAPARKDGYKDQNINRLLEDMREGEQLIQLLEHKFWDIMTRHGIEI